MNFKISIIIAFLTHSILGFAQSNAVSSPLCHPAIDPRTPQYIIGYGSLIQKQSRKNTYHYAENALPVMIYGYQRGWFTRGERLTLRTTFLNVVPHEKSQFNGVIFKVNREGMMRYDAREKYYCRETVCPSHISVLNHQKIPHGQFWIYIAPPAKITAPSANYPILQSYVDIFLSGCLAVQKQYGLKNFANTCIDTTYNWSSYWINDRIYPRRSFEHQPAATQIDELLSEKMPGIFQESGLSSCRRLHSYKEPLSQGERCNGM